MAIFLEWIHYISEIKLEHKWTRAGIRMRHIIAAILHIVFDASNQPFLVACVRKNFCNSINVNQLNWVNLVFHMENMHANSLAYTFLTASIRLIQNDGKPSLNYFGIGNIYGSNLPKDFHSCLCTTGGTTSNRNENWKLKISNTFFTTKTFGTLKVNHKMDGKDLCSKHVSKAVASADCHF